VLAVRGRDIKCTKHLNTLFKANNELLKECVVFVLAIDVFFNSVVIEYSSRSFILVLEGYLYFTSCLTALNK
jgi:hypothetical protein